MLFQISEGTAAQRRVALALVDATDGITPETGESGGQPQVSKQGGSWANTTATLSAIGNGAYYVELTATELDTVGLVLVRYKSANTAEAQVEHQVVPWDPYDAVRMGVTALPNANAEAAGGLYTRGSGAGQINQNANGQTDTRTVTMATDVITAAAIQADAIGAAEIANGAIDAATFAAGAIDATAIATDALGALELAAGAATEIAAAVWDEARASHTTAGTFGQGAASVQGNVTGAVGSVTGNVGGNVTGSVGSVAAGGITASSIAPDAIGASELAADAVAEIADQVWDEVLAGHLTAGTTGAALSGAGGGGAAPTAAAVADAVWDEAIAGHLGAGSTGAKLNGLSGASGSGAITHVITVTSSGSPVDGALVWVTTDAAGANVVASGFTDALGHVTVFLDAGTYYQWAQRGGTNFVNGQSVVVA